MLCNNKTGVIRGNFMRYTFFPMRKPAIKTGSNTHLLRTNTSSIRFENVSYKKINADTLNLPKTLPHLRNLTDFDKHGYVSFKPDAVKPTSTKASGNFDISNYEAEFSLGKNDTWQDIMQHIEKNPGQYLLMIDLSYQPSDSQQFGIAFKNTGHIVYYHSVNKILIGKDGGKTIPEFGTFMPINQDKEIFPGLSNSLFLLKAEYEHDLSVLLQNWQNTKKTVTIRYIGEATVESANNAEIVKAELQINQVYCLRSGGRVETYSDEISCESRKEDLLELFRQYKVPPKDYYLAMQKTTQGSWELIIQVAKSNCCAAVRTAVSGFDAHDWEFPMQFDRHETTPRQELKEISRHLTIDHYSYGKFFEYNVACQKQALSKFKEWVAVNKTEDDSTPKLGI